jgi:hypothetical protein
MVETDAMPSALFGDFVTLTVGKTVDWKHFFANRGGFFCNKEPIVQRGTKEEPIARILLVLCH